MKVKLIDIYNSVPVMNKILEIVQTKEYTGTLESLEELVDNLKLKTGVYL